MEDRPVPRDKDGYEILHRCYYCHLLHTYPDMVKQMGCMRCRSRRFYETQQIKNDEEIEYLTQAGFDLEANGFTEKREGNLPSHSPEYKDMKGYGA